MNHFCVNCGAPLVTKVIEGREVEACANDDFVLWREPKLATAVVVEADGGVVLGRRAIEPGIGLWCLPGGFVNHDEDPARAAARECMEEIGAQVELTGLIGVYHIAKSEAPSMVGIAYRGRLVDGAELNSGPEMLEVRVFPTDRLPQLAFPSHTAVLAEFFRFPASPVGAAPLRVGGEVPPAAPPSEPQAPPRQPRTP